MSQISPLASVIAQGLTAQRLMSVEKERQLRHEQVAQKNVAAESDHFEHQVESTEKVEAVNEDEGQKEQPDRQPPRRQKKEDEDKPHIDVKA